MELKCRAFDDYKQLVDFINRQKIKKNRIQQIVHTNYLCWLYWWE